VNALRWMRWKGFLEKVRSEFQEAVMDGDDGRDELRWWGWKEWEKNDQVDGMKQEVYSKGHKEIHNELSDLWFLKRKMKMVER